MMIIKIFPIYIMIKTAQCCRDETKVNYEKNRVVYADNLNALIESAIKCGEFKTMICLPDNFDFSLQEQEYLNAGYTITKNPSNVAGNTYWYFSWA